MPPALSPPERKALAYIRRRLQKGEAPTVRDLARYGGWPVATAHRLLGRLEEKGRIRRVQGVPRGIEVIA